MTPDWFRRRAPDLSALARAHAAMARAEALVHFGSWQWDDATGRVSWSPELHRIYGLEPGTFEGGIDDYLRRVHPDDRAMVRATVLEAHREKRSFHLRERIIRAD